MPATIRRPAIAPRGTAIVVHGLAGWKDQPTVTVMAEAATGAGLISVTFDDSNGVMGPDMVGSESTPTSHLRDLDDVVTYVQEQQWYVAPLSLMGHSLGGLISLKYAFDHPGRVSTLVLVAPSVVWHKDNNRAFWKKIRFSAHAMKNRDERIPAATLYPKWIFDFMKYDARKYASVVAVPTLIISGGDDVIVAHAPEHEKLAASMPNGTHAVILGASHIFALHEQELADTIAAWHTSLSD